MILEIPKRKSVRKSFLKVEDLFIGALYAPADGLGGDLFGDDHPKP